MKILKILFLKLSFFGIIYANEIWRNTQSLQADFAQEIKGDRGAIPVVYTGTFYASDNKVKWEYKTPLPKEVYLQRNEAYIYEPHLKQVTIGTLKENIDFIQILKEVQKVDTNIYQTTIADTVYSLHIKDNKPYSLIYKDNLDNNVTIIFENIKINQAIDGTIFLFQAPDDVDYIDAH